MACRIWSCGTWPGCHCRITTGMPAALLHILYMPRVSGPGLASCTVIPHQVRHPEREHDRPTLSARVRVHPAIRYPPRADTPRTHRVWSRRSDRGALRGGSAPRKAWPDHRHARPVVLVLVAEVFDQVSLLEADRNGHVDRHRDREQEVAQGHRRRHPEGRGPPDIERVADATVKHRRAERQVRVLTASQVVPHLAQSRTGRSDRSSG